MHRSLPKQLRLLLFTVLTLIIGQVAFAQNDEALKIADAYLKSNLEKLRLTPADLQDYRVSDHYTSKHNGVSHIYLLQKHSDILVRNGMININILPNG